MPSYSRFVPLSGKFVFHFCPFHQFYGKAQGHKIRIVQWSLAILYIVHNSVQTIWDRNYTAHSYLFFRDYNTWFQPCTVSSLIFQTTKYVFQPFFLCIRQHLYNSFSEFNNRKFFWHFKCFVRNTYLPSLSCFRYSLSYIPFARRMVSNLMIRLCDTEL